MAGSTQRASDRELRWLLVAAVVAVLAVMVALSIALLGREVSPAPGAGVADSGPAPRPAVAADPVATAESPASPMPAVDSADEPAEAGPSQAGPVSEPDEPAQKAPETAIQDRERGFSPPRSPFPQPGESIVRPLPAVRLADASARVAAPSGVISWDQAPRYVGQTVTVEGKIVRAHSTGRVCFLNFVENYRGRFYIILFQSALGGWPQRPEIYFPGKTIRVTGEVQLHNSSPQIQVRAADQVQIITSE